MQICRKKLIKYLQERGKQVSNAEINRLASGFEGVRKTTGQHPGGVIVCPKELDIHDFLEHSTHFLFFALFFTNDLTNASNKSIILIIPLGNFVFGGYENEKAFGTCCCVGIDNGNSFFLLLHLPL